MLAIPREQVLDAVPGSECQVKCIAQIIGWHQPFGHIVGDQLADFPRHRKAGDAGHEREALFAFLARISFDGGGYSSADARDGRELRELLPVYGKTVERPLWPLFDFK